MSFHFEGHCRSFDGARNFVNLQVAPAAVKDLLHAALKGLAEKKASEKVPVERLLGIHIKATGHLCEDVDSYERSTVELLVEPLWVVD